MNRQTAPARSSPRRPADLWTPFVFAAVGIAWAGGLVAGKLGVTAVPPFELAAVRFLLTGVVLFAVVRLRNLPMGLERLGLIAISGAFGVAALSALLFTGLTLAPASDSGLILPTLAPVMTGILGVWVGERLTRFKIVGLAVASIGVALVVLAGQSGREFSRERLVGDLLFVGAALCQAVYNVLGTFTLRSGSPLGVTALTVTIGGSLLLPLGFLEHGYRDLGSWHVDTWLAVTYMSLVATIVGFGLLYWAVARYGVGLASLATYLVPVCTVVLAVLILGETVHPLQLAGGAVTVVGVRIAAAVPTGRSLPGSSET